MSVHTVHNTSTYIEFYLIRRTIMLDFYFSSISFSLFVCVFFVVLHSSLYIFLLLLLISDFLRYSPSHSRRHPSIHRIHLETTLHRCYWFFFFLFSFWFFSCTEPCSVFKQLRKRVVYYSKHVKNGIKKVTRIYYTAHPEPYMYICCRVLNEIAHKS